MIGICGQNFEYFISPIKKFDDDELDIIFD